MANEVVILARLFKFCGYTHSECRLYRSVLSIEVEDISGTGGIYIQSDGEHLGFLPKKIRILPAAIEMIV